MTAANTLLKTEFSQQIAEIIKPDVGVGGTRKIS